MDQTAEVNTGPVPNPIPNITPQTPAPSSGKPKRVFYVLIIIILAAGLVIGGYSLRRYVQSKKVPAATTGQTKALPAGFTKAQGLINAGGVLVARSGIQITYSGILTAVDPGRSWTLIKGGKTVTIRQEGGQQVKYFQITAANTPGQSIEASDLKVGDAISLVTLVDTKTGVISVTNIIIIITPKPGGQATPSASPAIQKP